jgi:hypothetical protein
VSSDIVSWWNSLNVRWLRGPQLVLTFKSWWVLWSSLGNRALLWTCIYLLTSSCTFCHWVLVVNYDMVWVYMPLNELYFVLSMAETSIRRVLDVLIVIVHNKKVKKDKWKGSKKVKGKGKTQAGSKRAPKPLKVSMPTPDSVCFQCNGKSCYNVNTKWLKILIRASCDIVG